MPKSIVPKKKLVPAKKIVKKDNVTEEVCVICMDRILKKNVASLDVCGHKYCIGCIKEWAKTENSCPQCKKKFKNITSLKRGCKKKKETIEVEDRRQRPDHYSDESDEEITEEAMYAVIGLIRQLMTQNLMNATSIRKWQVLSDQVMVFDLVPSPPESLLEGPGCVNPLDLIGIEQIWLDRVYSPLSRINIMIYFMLSANFRHRLIGELATPIRCAGSACIVCPRRKVIAHMVFNVIHRFMLLNHEGSNASVYSQWWRRAKTIVFGSTGEADNPIVLGVDTPPERPDHQPLNLNDGQPCIHSQLKKLLEMINSNITMDSNVRVYV